MHQRIQRLSSTLLTALALIPAGAQAGPAQPSLQCYGKAFQSLSTQSQFKPELFQLDGTCYSYAATAALESAYARKHGKLEQILPTAAALRNSGDEAYNLARILLASPRDPSTGTMGKIPDGFYDGGLVALVQANLSPSLKNPKSNVLPRYSAGALLEFQEFSSRLVDESSCQYYDREPLHAKMSELESGLARTRGEFDRQVSEQDKLFKSLDTSLGDREQTTSTLARIRDMNSALEKLNGEMQKAYSCLDETRKEINTGTEGDRALSCTIRRDAEKFEAELIRKHGGVDISGLRPVVLFSDFGPNRPECTPQRAEQRRKQLVRALCAGIPVAIGTPNISRFLVRGGTHPADWTPHAPSGANGDVTGQGHALTLKGFEDIRGVPHFIFRNSWGAGSEAAIPVTDTCNIDEAVVFLDSEKPRVGAPGTPRPVLSELDAWNSSNDDALRTFSIQQFRKGLLKAQPR